MDPTHFLVTHDHVDPNYERGVTVTDRLGGFRPSGRP
jgi:hypothetical protein